MKIGIISIIGLFTIGVGEVQAGTISISSSSVITTTKNITILPSTLVTPQDFSSIDLGEVIVGPLGSVVSDDFTTVSSQDIGDLNSSVFANSATGLFTYTHQVTPGVDNINSFAVNFPATGFNGIAGYNFSESNSAGGNGEETDFEIVSNDNTDETITWNIPDGTESFFDAGETITFFWQSTLRPVGPFGTYSLDSGSSLGNAIGPTPNAPVPEPVNEPRSLGLLTCLGFLVITNSIKAKNTCR